jgi:hypothetical protein
MLAKFPLFFAVLRGKFRAGRRRFAVGVVVGLFFTVLVRACIVCVAIIFVLSRFRVLIVFQLLQNLV